jgi:hypothetical protein
LLPDQLFQRSQDIPEIQFNIRVLEPNHAQTLSPNEFFPQSIPFLLIVMYQPIQFHNESFFMTVEVGKVEGLMTIVIDYKRMLSSKLETQKLPIPHGCPEDLLRVGFSSPQVTSDIASDRSKCALR